MRYKEDKELYEAMDYHNPLNSTRMNISYFSDFIFMQQLMILEVDILLGQTENSMKYLDLNEKVVDELPKKSLRKSKTMAS